MVNIQGLLEAMESRMLLSAAALSADGVLRIVGDQKAKNQIDVSVVATSVAPADPSVAPDPNAAPVTINNIQVIFNGDQTKTQLFAAAQVKKVQIVGGNMDDTITVKLKSDDGSINIPAMIWGRNGNDTITAGDEIDWIKGGKGDDTITAGGGADRIWGEQGKNTFYLGESEPARDWVFGDARNDELKDNGATDQLKIKHMTKAQKAALKPANPHKPAKPAGKAAPG